MNVNVSRILKIGAMLFLGGILLFGGNLPGEAKDVGGQSPVLIVAPNYTDTYTPAGGHQSLPGSPVYLTPDGYPVMRTPQGEWVYMVNPEAVRIPGPQITVITPGVPLVYGYPYPGGTVVLPQSTVVPQPQLQGMVLPPVSSGQITYYPTGYGGFVVQPQSAQ